MEQIFQVCLCEYDYRCCFGSVCSWSTTECFIISYSLQIFSLPHPLNFWGTWASADIQLSLIHHKISSAFTAVSCTSLTELHQKTFYISPSVLTNISELGEGIHVTWMKSNNEDVCSPCYGYLCCINQECISLLLLFLEPIVLEWKVPNSLITYRKLWQGVQGSNERKTPQCTGCC